MRERKRVQLICPPEEGKTQQHFQEECNINTIVERFKNTGVLEHQALSKPEFGYATSQTFTEAAYIVADATENFMQLPSNVRAHFHNDPAQYLDAIADEARRPEFVELGLLDGRAPSIKKDRRTDDKPPPEAKIEPKSE